MNSIFRNLPHKEAKRKRDKIGHFRIAFSADTKSYPVSCQHLSDLWRSTLEIGAAQPSLRYRNHAARYGFATLLQNELNSDVARFTLLQDRFKREWQNAQHRHSTCNGRLYARDVLRRL